MKSVIREAKTEFSGGPKGNAGTSERICTGIASVSRALRDGRNWIC